MPHLFLVVAAVLVGSEPQSPSGPPTSPAIDVVTALENALVEAIARAEPSVVAIARDKDGKTEETTAVRGRKVAAPELVPEPRAPFGAFRGDPFAELDQPDYIASDYGSGVVIGTKGEILTTFSVVRGASRLLVRAKGTSDVFDAEVIAADPRSDLAVIVPCESPTRGRPFRPLRPADAAKLRPLVLGDATKLQKGNFLLALGNPFNSSRDGRASASWGILANIARRLDSSHLDTEPTKRQLRHYPTLLQLDAKLNLGMSGGAVINLKGELVGLTTDAANVGGFDAQAGYAIPIDNLSRRAIDALRQGREVEYGFLGIGLSRSLNNQIGNVNPGTPAGEGGLLVDDFILAIGDLPVVDADSLVMAVNSFTPGAPIKLRLRRDDREIEKSIILSKLPIVGEVIATVRPESWRGLRVDFVSTNLRSNRGNDVLEAMAKGGVIITEVQPGSPADDAELKPGQIVIAVEDQPIRSPADFTKAVRDRRDPVVLTTEGNQRVTIK